MSIKISELPSASSVGSSDVIPIVQEGTTKKATAGMIAPTIATSITSSSTNDEVAGAKAVYDFAEGYMTWGRFKCQTGYDFALGTTHSYVKIPLTLYAQNSNVFSLSNNEIVISKNITTMVCSLKVPVSTQSTAESRYVLCEITRNGTSLTNTMTETYCPANATTTITIPISIGSAQAGDHIDIKVYGQSGDKIYRGNMDFNILGFNVTDATTTLSSLNTASLMNTGSLAGMGDRAELLANELAGKDVENTEQIDEQVENISAEPIETKTEGSGDIK